MYSTTPSPNAVPATRHGMATRRRRASDDEDHRGDRVAPAEKGRDRRTAIERELPEDRLDRERDPCAETEKDTECVRAASGHGAKVRLVQR